MTKYQKYKLVLVAFFCSIFLMILHNYSENNRYEFHKEKPFILDTRSGDSYIMSKGKYELNRKIIKKEEIK